MALSVTSESLLPLNSLARCIVWWNCGLQTTCFKDDADSSADETSPAKPAPLPSLSRAVIPSFISATAAQEVLRHDDLTASRNDPRGTKTLFWCPSLTLKFHTQEMSPNDWGNVDMCKNESSSNVRVTSMSSPLLGGKLISSCSVLSMLSKDTVKQVAKRLVNRRKPRKSKCELLLTVKERSLQNLHLLVRKALILWWPESRASGSGFIIYSSLQPVQFIAKRSDTIHSCCLIDTRTWLGHNVLVADGGSGWFCHIMFT